MADLEPFCHHLPACREWDEAQRMEFLVQELNGKRPLLPPDLPMSAEVSWRGRGQQRQQFDSVVGMEPCAWFPARLHSALS